MDQDDLSDGNIKLESDRAISDKGSIVFKESFERKNVSSMIPSSDCNSLHPGEEDPSGVRLPSLSALEARYVQPVRATSEEAASKAEEGVHGSYKGETSSEESKSYITSCLHHAKHLTESYEVRMTKSESEEAARRYDERMRLPLRPTYIRVTRTPSRTRDS